MKLLIVGSDEIYSIENFYVQYLREAGIPVEIYTAQKYFYQYYQQSTWHKIAYLSGLSFILPEINRGFKKVVERFQPDIIWVFKGMEIYPSSLQWAKQQGIKLINFNGDNPFIFSGRGSGNKQVSNSIGIYDRHLTYNSQVKQKMEQDYQIPTDIVPFGFDISDKMFNEAIDQAEVNRVCFMGNPDKERGIFLQSIADAGIALDLYGNNWTAFIKHPAVLIHEPIYGAGAWKVLRRYRVQLNLLRPHNTDTHNMRSFELGGVGGLQLAPATRDHETFFEPGKEIFLFNSPGECLAQISTLLAMPAAEANACRRAARQRSIQNGYDYRSRARQVLQIMEEMFE